MHLKQLRILIIGVFVLLALILIAETNLTENLGKDSLEVLVTKYGAVAPFIYMGVYALATVLFIPGSPLTLAGGALFGPVLGTLYTVIGATVGAVLAFLLTRTLKNAIPLPQGQSELLKKVQKYDARMGEHGFVTMLFLRFVPLFPFNGLNFALGFTSVSFRDYALGTFIGIIPGTFAYTYFGDSLAMLSVSNIAIGIGIIILVTLSGRYFYKRYNAQLHS